jgi:hypothetical protein
MKFFVPFLFLCCSFFSCASSGSAGDHPDNADTLALFHAFVKKFPVRPLPFHTCISCNDLYNAASTVVRIEDENIFLPKEFSWVNCWGMLPDTSINYFLIWTVTGDNIIPFLAIYNKKGTLLSCDPLTSSGGGWGPCFEFSAYASIEKDYSVHLFDTTWNWECDSAFVICDSSKVKIERTVLDGKITGGMFIKQEKRTEEIKK